MTQRIYISHDEHIKLLRAAPYGEFVATSFGSGAVWLGRDADGKLRNPWVLPLLAEWRGITVNDGAGI